MSIHARIHARRDLDDMRARRDISGLAQALNAQPDVATVERFVTARTVLAECADGAAILDALESASTAIGAVRWAIRFLGQDSGLDVGNHATQGMIAQLVAGSVLTQSQGDQLKALALATVVVTQEQVAVAMYNPDGSEK